MRVRILTVIRGVAAITLAMSAAAQMVPQLPNAPFSAEMVSTRSIRSSRFQSRSSMKSRASANIPVPKQKKFRLA